MLQVTRMIYVNLILTLLMSTYVSHSRGPCKKLIECSQTPVIYSQFSYCSAFGFYDTSLLYSWYIDRYAYNLTLSETSDC
jgi:hypothetical protein